MEKIKFKAHIGEVSNTRRKIINSKGLAVKAWIDVLMIQCKEEALDKLFELASDEVYDLGTHQEAEKVSEEAKQNDSINGEE